MTQFRRARDRAGQFGVDWSICEEGDGPEAPSRIEFIPFSKGDARVPSLPADETMYCAVGTAETLTYALIALRVGDRAVHVAMTPHRLRHFARALMNTVDIIEAQPGYAA